MIEKSCVDGARNCELPYRINFVAKGDGSVLE
jgi:hypothetical protein